LSGSGCQSLESMDARDGEMPLGRHMDGPIDGSWDVKERCKHDMLPGSCGFCQVPPTVMRITARHCRDRDFLPRAGGSPS
jgi:hypothetical protein